MLGICFALSMLGRGVGESFTVFLLPISGDLGLQRADVVSVYSTAALSAGLAAPLVGRLFDRSGPRAVYVLGLLLLGAGLSLAPFARSLWQLQLCIGLTAGLGTACLGNVTSSLLLGRWFGARLPTAMAVVYSAAGAGTLLLLPLSAVLIERAGWRGAYHTIGAALLVLVVPLVMLPWRRFGQGTPPAAVSNAESTTASTAAPPAASPAASPAGSAAASPAAPVSEPAPPWTLAAALRHHAFWSLLACYFFTAVGMFAISVQAVAYLIEAGFAPLQAAAAWGSSGVLLVIGMLTVSVLDGLIGRRRAILLSYSLSTAGIVMFWFLRSYPALWLLIGFVVCFGSTNGSRGPLISATAMSIFRGKRVGTIFGAITLGSGLGSALGSWSGGLIHDWTGSYDWVIAFALVNLLLGMAPFLFVPLLRESAPAAGPRIGGNTRS